MLRSPSTPPLGLAQASVFAEWRAVLLAIDLKRSCLWFRHPSCPLITNLNLSEPSLCLFCPQPISAWRQRWGQRFPSSLAESTSLLCPNWTFFKPSGPPALVLEGLAHDPGFSWPLSVPSSHCPIPQPALAWPDFI